MKKQSVKIIVDVIMTVLLLLLMAFELIGRTAHEWFGVGMFVMFVIHHILNRRWTAHLLKGKYTPVRVFQTILVVLVLLCILSSMVSGIVLSRHVFAFLPIEGVRRTKAGTDRFFCNGHLYDLHRIRGWSRGCTLPGRGRDPEAGERVVCDRGGQ